MGSLGNNRRGGFEVPVERHESFVTCSYERERVDFPRFPLAHARSYTERAHDVLRCRCLPSDPLRGKRRPLYGATAEQFAQFAPGLVEADCTDFSHAVNRPELFLMTAISWRKSECGL